jgi:hypothetical protein
MNGSRKKTTKLTKVSNLPVELRACTYIFTMGLIGGGLGVIHTEIQAKQHQNQILSESNRVESIGVMALAGMIAASVISFSAILDDKQ